MIDHISIPEERINLLKRTKGWEEQLKDFLDVKVSIGEDITIEGEALQVIRAKEILKAFGRGFSFKDSLDLLDEECFLEIIDVSEFTGKSRNRQVVLKGRVIGEEGRTKKMIEKCANVKIVIYGKTVSIIGKPQNIKIARNAVEMILSGSKHNSVYRFLQENKVM
ncbi:MAG: KH domain-containing protein [Candidatus Aenigmatarchaeota archaeon]|nr:KH domain-containing protein [Candidatus Aenigmarchaeota archaeon]